VEHGAVSQRDRLEAVQQTQIVFARQGGKQAVRNTVLRRNFLLERRQWFRQAIALRYCSASDDRARSATPGNRCHAPALGDIPRDSVVALELVLPVEDRLAAEADIARLAGAVGASKLEVTEGGAPLEQPSMHLPVGLRHVEGQFPEPLADDSRLVGRAISGRGARMRNEPVALI